MTINWEKHTITVNGVEYLIGTAGSIVLGCEVCGRERFRDPFLYFNHPPEWETCFCDSKPPMVPIRYDELDTKWKPMWRKVDGPSEAVSGDISK